MPTNESGNAYTYGTNVYHFLKQRKLDNSNLDKSKTYSKPTMSTDRYRKSISAAQKV